jgi:ParB family transcriptional regulator, chromosome partitioning protein
MVSQFAGDSIFWIEVDKIKPNPYQPRREFDEGALNSLADSIRQYGILQPLVVTRNEQIKEDGGLITLYELISGERRLRASKIAGLGQVPVVIRSGTDDARTKLELAIIENLQREDLNPVDRAKAFQQLVNEFGFKHGQIADKVGKSREYVSNTMRILLLPEEMITALTEGKITEGHTRPLLMLMDRPEEQMTLFKEIIYKRLTVREAEAISRKVAFERARRKEKMVDPEIVDIENRMAESLGTRVHIEKGTNGGQVKIDFFSAEDLRSILDLLQTNKAKDLNHMLDNHIAKIKSGEIQLPGKPAPISVEMAMVEEKMGTVENPFQTEEKAPSDDRSKVEIEQDEEELYSINKFSI